MELKAIKNTLEAYANAYCSKDIDAMMLVFDNSDNISVIGTGADEYCVGQEEVRELFLRNFKEATTHQFEWNWIDVRLSNNHAIVSVTLLIHLTYQNTSLKVPIRWTVVLKKENGRWLWIHRNASVAASNQDEGQAYSKENSL